MPRRGDVAISLCPSRPATRLLKGFAPRLAALAGTEGADLRGHEAFRAAVRAARTRHPRPEGTPRALLVRTSGGEPALAPADDALVLAVAHLYETFSGRVEAVVGPAYRTEVARAITGGRGIRLVSGRRLALHPDPARDAEIRAMVHGDVDRLSTRFVEGRPGDGFMAALARSDPWDGSCSWIAATVDGTRIVLAAGRSGPSAGPVDAGLVAALLASGAGPVEPSRALQDLGHWDNPSAIQATASYRALSEADEAGAFGRGRWHVPSRVAASMARQALAASRRAEGRFVNALGDDTVELRHALHGAMTMARRAGDRGAANAVPCLVDVVDGTDAEGRRRVLQGCRLSPLAATAIVAGAARRDVVRTMVEGRQLREAELAALGLEGTAPGARDALRTLRGLPLVMARSYGDSVRELHRASPGMPPLTLAALNTLHDVMSELHEVTPFGHLDPGTVSAFRAARGTLVTGRRRVVPVLDMVRWLRGTAEDAARWLRGNGRDARSMSYLAVREALLQPGRRFGGLEDLSHDWHRELAGHIDEADAFWNGCREARGLPVPDGAAVFPHVLPSPVTVGGVLLAPLLDAASLKAEGRDMSHCVGGYVTQAMGGASMIVALSSGGGRSTAELHVARSGDAHSVQVRQHRGRRNGNPPAGHAAALRAVLSGPAVSRDRLAALHDRVGAATAWVNRARSSITLDDAEAERFGLLRHAQFAAYLPRSHPGRDPKAWVEGLAGRLGVPAWPPREEAPAPPPPWDGDEDMPF